MAAESVVAEVLLQCTNDPVQIVDSLITKLETQDVSSSSNTAPLVTAQLLVSLHNHLAASTVDTGLEPLPLMNNVSNALTLFIRRLLAASEPDDINGKILAVVELCVRASSSLKVLLVSKLVQDVLRDLERTIDYCCAKDASDDNFSLGSTWLGKLLCTNAFALDQAPPLFGVALTLLRCLAMHPDTAAFISPTILRPLLILLAAAASDISEPARDTLLAIFAGSDVVFTELIKTEILSEQGQSSLTTNDIWSHIFDLVESHQVDLHRTNGYSIWLAILSCRPEWASGSKIFHESRYWVPLQSGLALGTHGHCKLCLAILKASIRLADADIDCIPMHFELSKRPLLVRSYDKFETVYVTIVLNRYVNQIRDCIEDLLSLLDPDSGIATPWLVALLSVSVNKGTQESIRKLFGNLIMDRSAPIISQPNVDLGSFFERFLPWAVQGSLFISLLPGGKSSTQCAHGERLSSFVKALIMLPVSNERCLAILRAILSYIERQNDHMFPYAKAFLLQGISQGFQERNPILDSSCATLLARVALQSGYLRVVGLWVLCTVGQLCRFSEEGKSPSPLARISQTAQKLIDSRLSQTRNPAVAANIIHRKTYSGSGTQLGEQEFSVTQLLTWLNDSKRKCLVQDGLLASCVYLEAALDGPLSSAEELSAVLDAIWDELDTQDFERDPLMVFPGILLHRNCMQLCQNNDALRLCIIKKVMTLQTLGQYKMHLFSALAAALRRTAVSGPNSGQLPWDEIIINFAQNPPVTKIEFQLEAVFAAKLHLSTPELSYELFYGKSEGRAYATFFDMLNATPITTSSTKHCLRALDALLQPWLEQKQPVPVTSKWKSTTQLQAMLILSQRFLPLCSAADVDQYLQKFFDLIAIEPLPRHRFLLEWMIARVYSRLRRRTEILEKTRDMDVVNPKSCVSMVKIALTLACVDDTEEDFGVELMTQLMILAASPKIAIRHEGQWSIPILWDHAARKKWSRILDNTTVSRLNSWLRTLEPFKNLPARRLLGWFDPRCDHTLSNLLDGDYLAMDPPEQSHATHSDLLALYADDPPDMPHIPSEDQSERLPFGSPRTSNRPDQSVSTIPDLTQALDSLQASQATPAPLQTKGDSWRAEIDALFANASASSHNPALAPSGPLTSPSSRRSRDLIVVASLIDNAHNIGGLSRVSEIFGAASLAVHDRRVLKSRDFGSVAVSSELWLPIEEVPNNPDSLIAYLTAKKLAGYTVVGIEQTDGSRVLGAEGTRLPERLVLVLGSEREGIPARVLGVCDWCVEIRQSGVTRSMNVQTAAGVVLYEYDREWGNRAS